MILIIIYNNLNKTISYITCSLIDFLIPSLAPILQTYHHHQHHSNYSIVAVFFLYSPTDHYPHSHPLSSLYHPPHHHPPFHCHYHSVIETFVSVFLSISIVIYSSTLIYCATVNPTVIFSAFPSFHCALELSH